MIYYISYLRGYLADVTGDRRHPMQAVEMSLLEPPSNKGGHNFIVYKIIIALPYIHLCLMCHTMQQYS